MNYTLSQLQIFIKIAQNQSVTRAAEELHMTQPAVSIQLKNFQEQFDIPLTEVVGRKLYITDFGKEIADAAEKIINQVYEINYKTLAYKGKLTGKLKISVVSTGKYVMPYFLTDFVNANPGIELKMDVTNKTSVLNSLDQNEVDFSLVSVLPDKMDIDRIDLIQNKLFLVGNAEKNFKKIRYKEDIFSKIPLIFREKGSGTRQIMELFFGKIGIKILKKLELTSNEAVKQAVLAGLGYSIMPLIGIRNEIIHGELQIIPVKGLPITTSWSLIWLKSKKHSPVAAAFLDFLSHEKNNIIDKNFRWFEQY